MRRTCEAGLIKAELTVANPWPVPANEFERLRRDGVPEIPAGATTVSSRSNSPERHTLKVTPPLASGGGDMTDTPEVRKAHNDLKITRNRLEQRNSGLRAAASSGKSGTAILSLRRRFWLS